MRGLPLLLVALGAASCASVPPGPTAAEVEAEARRYNEEMGTLFEEKTVSKDDSLAFDSKWAARFEVLARSEDTAAADVAFESLMLALSNLFITEANFGFEPTAGARYLDAAESWVRRIPDSKRLGIAATFMQGVAQEEPLIGRALAVLGRMEGSPDPEVRCSAILATGQMHQMAGREGEADEAYGRVVREFPETSAAKIAAGELKRRGIHPGAEAPDFELADLSGGRVRLSSLRGKAVLLNFWGMG